MIKSWAAYSVYIIMMQYFISFIGICCPDVLVRNLTRGGKGRSLRKGSF